MGETKQALKARVNQHRRPRTNEAQNSSVYLHIKETRHSFNIKDATILDLGRTVASSWQKGSDLGTSGGAITKQRGRTPLQPFSCMGPGD